MQKAHLHLIKWAVARGYSVMVFGEGELDGVFSTYEEIKDNVEACDMGQMDLVTRNVLEEQEEEAALRLRERRQCRESTIKSLTKSSLTMA